MEARWWTSRLHLPSYCYCCSIKLPILLLFVLTFIAYHYLIMMMMNASSGIANCDPRIASDANQRSSLSATQSVSNREQITVRRTNVTKHDQKNHRSFKRTLLTKEPTAAAADGHRGGDSKWHLLKHRHLHSKLRKANDPKRWNHWKRTRLRKLKLHEEYLRLAKAREKHGAFRSPTNDVHKQMNSKPAAKEKQRTVAVNSTVHNASRKGTSSKRPRPQPQPSSNHSNDMDLLLDNLIPTVTAKSSSSSSSSSNNNMTAKRRLPQALIIGVKKGGTRALLEFIRLHPDVRAVGPETHFFDRHYHKGLHWYRQQMPPTLDSQLTMEKTPSYFVTREVPRRMFSMAQDIKLLVVVRDPVTRAISDYAQTVSKRRHMRAFDELAFLNNVTGLVDTSWGAIKIGVYARHLENWLQYFPLHQFHFVSGERLIKDPAGEIAKVQDFLGVRRIVTENHFYFNETKGFPCLKKSERNGSLRCLGKTKGRTHPNVDNSTLNHLRDFFRPFNMKFYQMTGVDFGWP